MLRDAETTSIAPRMRRSPLGGDAFSPPPRRRARCFSFFFSFSQRPKTHRTTQRSRVSREVTLSSRSSADLLCPGSARTPRNHTRARSSGRNRGPACAHGRERNEAPEIETKLFVLLKLSGTRFRGLKQGIRPRRFLSMFAPASPAFEQYWKEPSLCRLAWLLG